MADELLRDLGGALLFGVPLVYTMEVWWLGETSRLAHLAAMTLVGALGAGFVRWVVIDRLRAIGAFFAGFRCTALSLVAALGLASEIGVLDLEASTTKVLGETAALGIPLALGGALGSVLFSSQGRDGDDHDDDAGADSGDQSGGSGAGDDTMEDLTPLGRDVVSGMLGALFIALPIAPTGEVPTIAAMTDTWRVVLAMPVCLVLCYVILFASGFLEHRGRHHGHGLAGALWATSTTTLVGVLSATGLLYAFGMLDAASPASQGVRFVAALSIPAVIGAAAGRLAAA
jgi:putative integral membrane protein (TIGR02587 family)